MRGPLFGIGMAVIATTVVAQTADTGLLQLETKIPLGSVGGRIDHMAVDLARHRLFVAELGNNTVSVVDFELRKVVHRISGLSEPQGVGYAQVNDALYVANGGDGSLRVFRGPDYAAAGVINLGDDADNIRIDTPSNTLFVGYGNGAIGVIDPRSNVNSQALQLTAHPEAFQFAPTTQQIFVNLPNAHSIAVLDTSAHRVVTSWPVPYRGNFPMALDPERKRVLVVFRNPAKFAAFDWRTGELVAQRDTCGDADDLFVDQKRNRVYISCGAGFIDILRSDDPKYAQLGHIRTVMGARTSLFVPEINRLFLAVRAQFHEPASIWVYRTAPR